MPALPEFDELLRLAEKDPDRLEALRAEMCEQLILDAPVELRRRLRGLQFRIDMERRRSSTPMAACIKISEMMHESFGRLRDALNEAQSIQAGTLTSVSKDIDNNRTKHAEESQAQPADILQFPVR
ncbi:MAG: DUF3135 domain-containing protein [Pseudomonadales bacterium]|nr:DUF3135 domain-containing protein [Pseudomonadales bacterium]